MKTPLSRTHAIGRERSQAMVELINEREDAAELLRGRTFARTLQ